MTTSQIGQYNTLYTLRNTLTNDIDTLVEAVLQVEEDSKVYRLLNSLAVAKGDILHSLPKVGEATAGGASPMSKTAMKSYKDVGIRIQSDYNDLVNDISTIETNQRQWLQRMTTSEGMSKDIEKYISRSLTNFLRIDEQLQRSRTTKQPVDIQV